MRGRRASSSRIVSIIVVFIAFFLVRSFLTVLEPKPPIEVTEYSLEPSNVKPNKPAEMFISIENSDHKTHQIKIVFEVSPRITIYEGAESQLTRTEQGYLYKFSIESEDPAEDKIFIVKASLEEGISIATYPIKMSVFVDGVKIKSDWDEIELTVKK